MRQLKLQVQMTVDGFVAGPNGEMDWMIFDWDDTLKSYVNELTGPIGGIVLGRKLAEGFIPHWAAVAANPENPDHAAGKKFTETPKVVFSRTLDHCPWENTSLAGRELVAEVTDLKNQEGGYLMAYGGATFVASLIKHGLIDEIYLFVNPVALGQGMNIFDELDLHQKMVLQKATKFDCGIVVLQYEPIR